ncbi:MAG: PIN domain-containing protein [bacterium]|nr:PIN domain-containing protein [bacterium]
MKRVLVDTNIIINFGRGDTDILLKLVEIQERREIELYVNDIVVGEYFAGLEMRSIKRYMWARDMFNSFFSFFEIDSEVAIKAGVMVAKNEIPILTDAIIASTCIINNLQLVTADVKHFNRIQGLKLFDLAKIS